MRKYILFLMMGCSCHMVSKEQNETVPAYQISFDSPKRLLLLDGENGSVACRIYGHLLSGTFPRLSDNWTVESATRSLLRMTNLTAVRGVEGASMVGPIDYFGNLEEPHKYLYVIEEGFPPVFYRTQSIADEEEPQSFLKPLDPGWITTVKARWISGKEERVIDEKRSEYRVVEKHLRQSLFLDPGLLEVDRSVIPLRAFDPRGVDLSGFKARLVDHSLPFRITRRPLPSKDDYRLITYLYEPLYAEWQVQQGSGLFLEKHHFSQTMTPLTEDSKGFVVLAKTREEPDELDVVGIQIPYGYTLIIDEGCIHGDTTLSGFFMMGMTSDHTTMRTADTVFLKYPETKKNVEMVLVNEEGTPLSFDQCLFNVVPPYVIYKDADEVGRERFKELTKGKNFIFNPFSREYWR